MSRLGIQIVTSRTQELSILLTSLLRQTYKKWDLILVFQDENIMKNHCVWSILGRMNWEGHRVKTIKADANLGIGALRNIALNADSNKWGLRLDDDSILDPNFIELLVNVIKKEPTVGCVGCTVPGVSNELCFRPIPKRFNKISEHLDVDDDSIYGYNCLETDYFEADHCRSSFMYLNERAKGIGGFPVEYDEYAAFREETDFSLRMTKAGFKNFIVPKAIAWHFASPNGGTRPSWAKHGHEGVWKADILMKDKLMEWWKCYSSTKI